jgi:hypothetical protein
MAGTALVSKSERLPLNNVFVGGYVINFEADGEQALARIPLEPKAIETDAYYTVKEEDEIDGIAYEVYKDTVEDASKYWWAIADANEIHEPYDLEAYIGKDLIIPNILKVQGK